ncbi:hypothetical protein [Actinoplanes sp. NPDC020271]|uniref:hypothetical protein n=1 Tax=Actinoplanes sp. NPDC020271 TaxID=3363896 RepID=UPI0037B5FAE1
MTDHGDRLRQAFESRESHTPDPAEVYARVVELSNKHKWRRRGATVAGGAALGAGLIAAVVNLPAVLPGDPSGNSTGTAPIVAAAPASPTPSAASTEAANDAFFAAGYTIDDAEALAKLWNMQDYNIASVKIAAGQKLLAGETLPIKPQPVETIPASVNKFFDAGYDWDDAVKLAKLWKLKSPYDAKVAGGEKLLAGKELPIKPRPANVANAKEEAQVSAFFDAGYNVDDAVELAKLWKLSSAYDAKVAGGKRILAGQPLPIKP